MKYGYDVKRKDFFNCEYNCIDQNKLIQNYKIQDDTIIITFLDGSTYQILRTKGIENEILNTMLIQAEERDNSSALINAKKNRKVAVIATLNMLLCFMLTSSFANNINSKNMRLFVEILTGIAGISSVAFAFDILFNDNEINELKKYRIYLNIRKELEESSDTAIFKGLNNKEKLNINTLDNYSLREIKRINANLQKDNYAASFNKSNPRLNLKRQ